MTGPTASIELTDLATETVLPAIVKAIQDTPGGLTINSFEMDLIVAGGLMAAYAKVVGGRLINHPDAEKWVETLQASVAELIRAEAGLPAKGSVQ